jgi:hypothetical protein
MTYLHDCTPECPPSHREHLNHMTDGRWHDTCPFCLRRREKGGTGLEGEAVPARRPESAPRAECSFCGAGIVLLGGSWTEDVDGTIACSDTSAPFVPHKPKEG